MKITRQTLKLFSEELNTMLDELGKKHGLALKAGNVRYNDSEFMTKITGYTTESGESSESIEFKKTCFRYGYAESDYGREFAALGTTYKLVGFKPKSRKYPVVAVNVNTGQRYKMPLDVLSVLKEKV